MALKSKVKYLGFGRFLKEKRELEYRSAREFTARVKTGVSYPQYSRYESGEQLPSLSQALLICQHLKVLSLETLLAWSKAQVASERTHQEGLSEILEEIDQLQKRDLPHSSIASFHVPLDQVVVFNRSHLEVFRRHPGYRDVFTYINALHPAKVSSEKAASALELSVEEVNVILKDLQTLGVVFSRDGLYGAAKRNFYFPDDADFFELRNRNLRHNFDHVMRRMRFEDIAERKAYRGIITREFTLKQVQWIAEQSERLLAQSLSLSEDEGGEAVYSLMTLVGERFRRN